MGNKNDKQKNLWIFAVGAFTLFAFYVMWWCEQHNYSSLLNNIFTYLGIIVTVILAKLAIPSSSSIQCNNKNKVQEEDSKEKQNDEAKKAVRFIWWNRNRRRIFISLALFFAILFVASFCYNLHDYRKQQIQQQYDALVDNYEKRMEQPIFFENAYELLVDDSIMLMQIIQMLDENPNLKVDTTDYSKQFENRAGEVIENINYAIFNLGLPHDDSLKYTKQKDKIEKMINSL